MTIPKGYQFWKIIELPSKGYKMMENITVNIPKQVRYLLHNLNDAGYEAYVVGGCVRDTILGNEPHDWDICTSATPEQMKEVFRKKRIAETGIKHGTISIIFDKTPYEITTFRKDGDYSDHRHPDTVEFTTDLIEDLKRRDFTINAMAAGLDGKIIDPFHGQHDLETGWIRCVGNANERFQEDALRILRAYRFVSRFGFALEDKTANAVLNNKELLANVSSERIQSELNQILMGEYAYIILLHGTPVLSVFLPEISPTIGFQQHNPHHYLDVWHHTVTAVTEAPKDLIIRLALLFHDLGKPQTFTIENGIGHFYHHAEVSADIAEKRLRQLRYDNKTIEAVTELVKCHDMETPLRKTAIRRRLMYFGETQLRRLLDVQEADKKAKVPQETEKDWKNEILALIEEIKVDQDCFQLKDLAINGNDIKALGIPEGRQIGYCLKNLLTLVMDDIIPNNKDSLLDMARKLLFES